jgi:hypothetical protein
MHDEGRLHAIYSSSMHKSHESLLLSTIYTIPKFKAQFRLHKTLLNPISFWGNLKLAEVLKKPS